jgi:hypothetical protein
MFALPRVVVPVLLIVNVYDVSCATAEDWAEMDALQASPPAADADSANRFTPDTATSASSKTITIFSNAFIYSSPYSVTVICGLVFVRNAYLVSLLITVFASKGRKLPIQRNRNMGDTVGLENSSHADKRKCKAINKLKSAG